MAVDTLSLAQQLRAAELPANQAEAIAAAIGKAIVEASATKADLNEVKAELKADLNDLRSELKTDLNDLRSELKTDITSLRIDVKTDMEQLQSKLLLWFIGTQFTMAAIVIAALKL